MLLRSLSTYNRAPSTIHAGERSVPLASLEEPVRAIASFLLRGRASLDAERVAILLSPGPHFIAALLGVARAGGCGLVLSPLHPSAESAYFCDDAKVRMVLTSKEMLSTLGQAEKGREVVFVEDLPPLVYGPLPDVRLDSPALQLYTSGTTGKPKGAVLSHANLEMQALLLREAWEVSDADTLLHALPLHHMHGLVIALLTALSAGASVRFIEKFDAARLFEAMNDATIFMGVPTMYSRLLGAFDAADPKTRERWAGNAKRLRLATSGSAALPVTLASGWEALTGSIPLERFGMTEIGVGMSNPLHGERIRGSVGWPLPTVETRVIDEAGNPSSTGELLVRGPSVFLGYFEKPEATKAAFLDDPAGGAPWFRTGDTVDQDASGRFRIVGRTSTDILKSGGYKLSALEIEEVLRMHPAVADAAVVGLPDDAWGEIVVAAVVAKMGQATACTTGLIREWGRDHLAAYKLPKLVVVMEDLPRNAMGKVVKPELRRVLALEHMPQPTPNSFATRGERT